MITRRTFSKYLAGVISLTPLAFLIPKEKWTPVMDATSRHSVCHTRVRLIDGHWKGTELDKVWGNSIGIPEYQPSVVEWPENEDVLLSDEGKFCIHYYSPTGYTNDGWELWGLTEPNKRDVTSVIRLGVGDV